MTEPEEQTQENSPTHLTMRDVGRLFTEAREAAALSLEDASAKLCLRPQQLQAIESGAVESLPGQTFVRGFIRSYAKLLQLDAAPLIEAYRRHAPDAAPEHIGLKSEHIPIVEPSQSRDWMPYLKFAIVVGMAVAAWMVYMDYIAPQQGGVKLSELAAKAMAPQEAQESPVELPASESMPAESPLASAPQLTTEAVTLPAPAPATAAAVNPPPQAVPQAVAPVVPAAPPAPAAPAASGAQLKLSFTAPSWVRIRDRDGKDLLNKTVPAGSTEAVSGMPPFRVEIGNTLGAQVNYNDKAVDLTPYTRANVARLTLE